MEACGGGAGRLARGNNELELILCSFYYLLQRMAEPGHDRRNHN